MTQRWFLPLALAALAFTGCTTAYKTGQTPDDVYYSPARPQDEYVKVEEDRDGNNYYSEDYYDDRYLRMKVRNRYQWSELNDWYVTERPYNYYGHTYYGYYGGCYCNDPWTPYAYWNSVYNPYYHPYIIVSPRTTTLAYNQPRTFNLNTYTPVSNPAFNYSNPKYNGYNYGNNNPSVTNPTRTNTRSNSGNVLRNIFGGGNNSGSSSSSGNHTNPSSSSGSSSSGSSSSGSTAPVRRF